MSKRLLKLMALSAICIASLAGTADASATAAAGAGKGWKPVLPHHKPDATPDFSVRQAKPSSLDRALASVRFQGMEEISTAKGPRGLANGTPDHKLDLSTSFGYLDGPDGTTWFYTGGTIFEDIQYENFTQQVATGYSYTVYDSKFNRIGSISDKVRLQGNELKAASIGLDAAVTKKFFNSATNTEVMVVLFFNNPDYSITTRTLVYTLDGETDEEGNSKAIASFEGMPIDAVNMAADKWSEDFFITFRNEIQPNPDDYETYEEYLQACAFNLTTYKKGGWNGTPSKVLEYSISMPSLPGDGMSSPYFMSAKVDGKPTFTIWHYAKPFFISAVADEPVPTPDNTLDIHTFKMNSVSGSEATLHHTTSIKTTPHTGNKILYTFYTIGLVRYTEDVLNDSFGGTASAPSYIVTTEDYTIADDDNYIYGIYAYDNDGNQLKAIAENAFGYVTLTTPAGADNQVAIINSDEFGYSFRIVSLANGEDVASFDQIIDRETLSAALDRVRLNGRDFYASAISQPEVDEDGVVYIKVAWISTDGHIDHVDRLPLGTDVSMSTVNIDGSILTPYIFDTDDEIEYMTIVKRRTGVSTQTREELVITSPSGVLMTVTPDAEMGALASLSVVNHEANPQLMVVYKNNSQFTQTFFDLPLAKFAGGDGTMANPYQIASVADLQQMKANPASFYTLVKDIDANGFAFVPVDNFAGVLDGAGHTIENFTLKTGGTYVGLLTNTALTAEVRNLTFINPRMHLDSNTDMAGLIAAGAGGIKIDNIHVYGLVADDTEDSRAMTTFGGIVGDAKSTASLTQCFVAGASIDLPEASGVGGIIGRGRTGVSVKACAFNGSINGSTDVGGIAGQLETGDETIADCHVDADLTAQNTVGGIAGSTKRSTLTRNYVEGSVTATTPGRWDKALAAGGIVGSMSTEYNTDDKDNVKVSHNIVALTALTAPAIEGEPEYDAQFNTVHRVAGRTGLNEAPYIIDYDENYNPIYDPEMVPYEGGLSDNYVVDILAPVEAEAAIHNGVDGQSIDRYEIDMDFLGEHGFKYGTDGANPWSATSGYDPALHFETGIIINPSDIQVNEGETFMVNILINTRRQIEESELFDDFMCEYDMTHIDMTGNYEFDGKTFAIEFNCLKAGVSQLIVKMLGSSASATVTGVSGIDETTVSAAKTITFDGRVIEADGCAISLYAVSGVKVAQGFGTLDVTALQNGVYVAVATAADGTRSQLKLAVR